MEQTENTTPARATRNYSRRVTFSAGMECPGLCGARLYYPEDCHAKYVMCYPCGAARKKANQAKQRATLQTGKCTSPGCERRFLLSQSSYKCSQCLKKRQTPATPKSVYKPFTGLRGPGGEWEHEPEAYRRREHGSPVHEGPWQ